MSPIIPRPRGVFPRRADEIPDLGVGQVIFRCPSHGVREPSEITFDEQRQKPLICAECSSPISFDIGPRTEVFLGVCSECGQTVAKAAPMREKATFREVHRRECPAAITCPRCDKTSYHPEDIRHGYCGYCHADTGKPRKVTHGRGKRLESGN